MKKTTIPFLLTLTAGLSLLLAGCSPSAAASTAGASPDAERQLPQSMQLALGTLALEETGQAITAEQAAALLPLWKAANSLTGADNVAAEETTGLFDQIQEAMTGEQMQAIQDMDLTGQSMAELASQYGFQMGGGAGPGNVTEEMQATMQAARASGQMPEGFTPGMAPPEGGGFRAEGGGPMPGGEGGGQGFFMQRGNSSSSSSQSAGATTGNPIYQAVIALLEKKAQ